MKMDGLLVIISAPSGAGKTTLIRRLLEEDEDCVFAVSHTTRMPRGGEEEGKDYYFVDEAGFRTMIENGEFAEWAEVHGRLYGTSAREVRGLMAAGRDVLVEVDYQGGRSLMRLFPEAVSVFILPPRMSEVRKRLEGRGAEDAEELRARLDKARVEIAASNEYKYAVLNDDLQEAVDDLTTIVRAERLRHERRAGLVRRLVAEE